jgi:hypothetical protein
MGILGTKTEALKGFVLLSLCIYLMLLAMPKSTVLLTLGLIGLLAWACTAPPQEEKETGQLPAEEVAAAAPVAPELEEGFVRLFNGENLNGWVGNKQSFSADEGTILVDPQGAPRGGNLYTEAAYSNFILRFEFQLTPGANNGLGYHAPLEGDAAYVGKELQILDNTAKKYADLEPWQYHGSLYGVIPAERGHLRPVGKWNEEEVIVRGTTVKVILNGATVLNGDYQDALKNGTLDGKEHPGLARTRGHIGFLGHGDVLRFRNIRIRDLEAGG